MCGGRGLVNFRNNDQIGNEKTADNGRTRNAYKCVFGSEYAVEASSCCFDHSDIRADGRIKSILCVADVSTTYDS